MIGVDTNVLLRTYLEDPSAPEQVAAARALISAHASEGVWISLPVLLETVWLLGRGAVGGHDRIVRFLSDLLDRDVFVVHERGAVEAALEQFHLSRIGYADCLIGALADENGVPTTYTFDRAAADFENFALVETGT